MPDDIVRRPYLTIAPPAPHAFSFTGAPLVVKDKVIVGVAGGEYGVRGFIDAYDVTSGQLREVAAAKVRTA